MKPYLIVSCKRIDLYYLINKAMYLIKNEEILDSLRFPNF